MKTLPLSRGYVALLDDDDFARISAHKWSAAVRPNGRVYAVRSERVGINRYRAVLMHRVVLGLAPGRVPEVDHINRDGLDNRKGNLRVATRAQNNANQIARDGRFKGVSWIPAKRKWRASIKANRRNRHLGYFDTAADAARAYDAAAIEAFGGFARLNGSFR